MIDTRELKGIFAKREVSQAEVAKAIGVTPKTFYEKMKRGVFGSDEIQKMIDMYQIEDPCAVFFCPESNLKSYK